ncbi:TPA: DotI/IcmL/TraM family protein [Escherichia coli]
MKQSEQRANNVPALIKALLCTGTCLLISITGNAIQYWHSTNVEREYFATDNGRLVRLAPTSQPAWSQNDAMAFGSQALATAFNLDFVHYRSQISSLSPRFSDEGFVGYPESVLKSANTLWLLRYKPEDIPVLRDNFNVPEFMLKRFLKMPEGPAPDGSGVPVLGVFRVKSGTLARILKFTVGPLELWALNSSPKDSALRKTLTNKLGSVRARKILAENFPRGSATSLIEHRAGQHNSDNVIEDLASELIRKQGYNL